jgi:methyltransferase family protein
MVKSEPDKRIKKLDVLADIKQPQVFPWKTKTGSIDELTCAGVFEYVPGKERGKFMDEVYRVLAPEGKATFTVPHWQSTRAFQDFRYAWPPLCEQSFLYFNKAWREANKLDLGLKCDFDFTYGYAWEATTAARSDEARAFNTKHYVNCVDAIQLVLTKARPTNA